MHEHGRKEPKARCKQSCRSKLKPLDFRFGRSWEPDTDLQAKLSLASEGAAQGAGIPAVWIARLVLQRAEEGRGPGRPAPTRRPACGPRVALSWRGRAGQRRCGRLLACAGPLPLTCALSSQHLTRLPGRALQGPGLLPRPRPRPRPEKPGQRPGLRPALGRRGCRASSQPLRDTGAPLCASPPSSPFRQKLRPRLVRRAWLELPASRYPV